jgi:hypothetical protein
MKMKNKKTSLFTTCLIVSSVFFVTPVKAVTFNSINNIVYYLDGTEIYNFNTSSIPATYNNVITETSGSPSLNPNIDIKFEETQGNFKLNIIGGNITQDSEEEFTIDGKYWDGNFKITQMNRTQDFSLQYDSDGVIISGKFIHQEGPHGEVDSPQIQFKGELSAIGIHNNPLTNIENLEFTDGSKTTNKVIHLIDPQKHPDIYKGFIIAEYDSVLINNDILPMPFPELDLVFDLTEYRIIIKGEHNEYPTSEPLTILGAGAGLGFLGLFGKIASKKKKKDSEEV